MSLSDVGWESTNYNAGTIVRSQNTFRAWTALLLVVCFFELLYEVSKSRRNGLVQDSAI